MFYHQPHGQNPGILTHLIYLPDKPVALYQDLFCRQLATVMGIEDHTDRPNQNYYANSLLLPSEVLEQFTGKLKC